MQHRPIPVLTPAQEARFFARVPARMDIAGCRRFIGADSGRGYKTISIAGVGLMCHRVAYRLHYGVDPGEFTVEHTCRTHDCVRGEHLCLMTLRDNVLADTSMSAGAVNARKLICAGGHMYNAENTRVTIDSKGRSARVCRICERIRYHVARKQAGFSPRAPKIIRTKAAPQTECIWGHPFSAANTRFDLRSDGRLHRACRPCEHRRSVAKRIKQKARKDLQRRDVA